MHALESKQADTVIGMLCFRYAVNLTHPTPAALAGGSDVWQAILNMVKSISEVMLTSLPNFWKISLAFLDGKYKKASTYFS